MARLKQIKPSEASGDLKKIFDGFDQSLGMVPNIFKFMGNFPEMIQAYIGMNQSLEKGTLGAALREKIALAVSETNNCNYCLAAHTQIGLGAGLKRQDTIDARLGKSEDKKEEAILQFSKKLVDKKGFTSQQDFDALKKAGCSDQEICEVFLTIMATIFTNYFNHFNDTPVDFPEAVKIEEHRLAF